MWYAMSYQTSVTINAPAERVWSELIDLEHWPLATPSVTNVERLDAGAFRLGSRARIKQPKLPPLVWTVTEFEAQKQFTWQTPSVGVTTIGKHELKPGPDQTTIVTLSIERRGVLAPLVDLMTASLTSKYVQLEAAGLKRVSEATGTPAHAASGPARDRAASAP